MKDLRKNRESDFEDSDPQFLLDEITKWVPASKNEHVQEALSKKFKSYKQKRIEE
jgi:hypothetical protein